MKGWFVLLFALLCVVLAAEGMRRPGGRRRYDVLSSRLSRVGDGRYRGGRLFRGRMRGSMFNKFRIPHGALRNRRIFGHGGRRICFCTSPESVNMLTVILSNSTNSTYFQRFIRHRGSSQNDNENPTERAARICHGRLRSRQPSRPQNDVGAVLSRRRRRCMDSENQPCNVCFKQFKLELARQSIIDANRQSEFPEFFDNDDDDNDNDAAGGDDSIIGQDDGEVVAIVL